MGCCCGVKRSLGIQAPACCIHFSANGVRQTAVGSLDAPSAEPLGSHFSALEPAGHLEKGKHVQSEMSRAQV
jgi:hypothetical protein